MRIKMRPATALPKMIIHRKVAAYCRVSTQQEIQHHSLEDTRKRAKKYGDGKPKRRPITVK